MKTGADYYGLSFNPFLKEEVRVKDHFPSSDFTEMMGRLNYLKDVRGIGLFTARPGMGKSFALRCFAEGLNPNLYHIEYICLSTVSVAEFYKQFCDVLGVSRKGGKPGRFRAIQEEVYYRYKEKKQPFILAVDEAQYLSQPILNDIKMLMNYGYDSLNCFTLILSGESHLNHILRKPVNEALRQRIMVHYDFQGLSEKEMPEYVRHKIRTASGSDTIINDAALAAVCSLSQGNPRIVDDIMRDALTIGAQKEKQTIDADVIHAAVDNQNL